MTTMTDKIRPLVMRIELDLEQWELAKEAGLTQPVISKIEHGGAIMEQTALKVFFAVNRIRRGRGLHELKFDDIAWNLA